MPPNADPTPKELFTGDTSYHPLMHLHVGAGSSALTRWVGFIRPLTITGSYPINISEEFSHSSSVFLATATETRLIEFGDCRLEFIKRQFTGFYRRHN